MTFNPAGIIPALVTPIDQGEKINFSALEKLIEHVIQGGVHGIFITGTTGEFYGLTHEEKKDLFQCAVDQSNSRVPVYAGTGAITTKESIQLTQIAESCNVDVVSILTPMFAIPDQNELIQHYQEIAENTSLPVILYNNVTKTGLNIDADTVEVLAGVKNIVGIKDSSGNFTLTGEYIRRTRSKDFEVLAGRDTLIYACLCQGGKGSISASANIAPRLCSDIYDKYVAGDQAGSLESQDSLAPLRMAFNLGSFPAVIKEALQLIGIEAGPCKAPIGPLGNRERNELRQILTDMALI